MLPKQKIIVLSNDQEFTKKVHRNIDRESCLVMNLPLVDLEKTYEQIIKINPHILLLDLSSHNEFSFLLLKKIANLKFEVIIIAENDKDAIKVIPYRPIEYLIKPVKEPILKEAITKAFQVVDQKVLFQSLSRKYGEEEAKLAISDTISFPLIKGRTIQLEIKNIIRIEADSIMSKVFLRNKHDDYTRINLPIKDCQELLNAQGFFRIHRQHLINLGAVHPFSNNFNNTVKLYTEEVLPVARRRQSEFESAFEKYGK